MPNDGPELTSFLNRDLVVNQNAEFDLFHPVVGIRDRFGNKIFSSKLLAYPNRREKASVKAALLMSPSGESFVKRNPGILRDIDRGIQALGPLVEKLDIHDKAIVKPTFELRAGRKLSYFVPVASLTYSYWIQMMIR